LRDQAAQPLGFSDSERLDRDLDRRIPIGRLDRAEVLALLTESA
jgi:hypothetical protein